MRTTSAVAWALLCVMPSACTQARRPKGQKAAAAAQKAPPPAAPATPERAAPAPAPAPATPGATTLADAKGVATLKLSLPVKVRLGGFALALTWDPAQFALGDPKIERALAGFTCVPNLGKPGSLRYNCVGLPADERGGVLATLPVQFKDRAPRLEDFTVVQAEVVDDMGRTLTEVHVQLEIVPPPA